MLVIQEMKGNILTHGTLFKKHTFKSQVFLSQKAQVQVKSQITGIKVQVEL